MPRRTITTLLLILTPLAVAPSLAAASAPLCPDVDHAVGPLPGGGGLDEKHRKKWWRWDRCQAAIALSDEQSDELEGIFQDTIPELHRLKTLVDERETHLSALLVEGMEEANVRAAIDDVEEARSDLGRTWTLMLYRMYKVLSKEQRHKLKAFWQRLEEEEAATEQSGDRREP